MMQLILRLVGEAGDGTLTAERELDWWLLSAQGALQHYGHHPLAAITTAVGEALTACRVTLLVPGELVLLTEVSIPSRQLRHIKQALPYQVEELIADNIEEVHLALPPMKIVGDRPLPVAVAAHQLLIQWLDQCYAQGIELHAIVPDTLATPWRAQSDLFFIDGERVLYRSDRHAGLVLPAALLATQLDALAPALRASLPRHCEVAGTRADEARVRELAERVGRQWGVEVQTTLYEERAGEVLALQAARQPEDLINLRQGGYAASREQGGTGRWWAVAAALGCGLALYAAVAAAAGVWFDLRADRLRADSVALYRELFPQERRVFSPQRQMAAQLGGGSLAGASPLPLLARISETATLSEVTLDELRVQGGSVQLHLRADSFEQLGQLQQQLRAAGFAAEISSASGQGDQTVGRLQITESRS